MSARIVREAKFDKVINQLRRDGRLKMVANRLNIPIQVVEQWECPPRPSAEIQLEIIAMSETHDEQRA